MNKTTTNYLSPTDFKKMVDAIPLVTEYNKGKLLGRAADSVPSYTFIQAALWIQYCHALRISEVLNLERDDFNFHRKILTLHRTKTGLKKCDCYSNIRGKIPLPNPNCKKCGGNGKIRKKQYTSIPPDLPDWIIDYICNMREKRIFHLNRQLLWRYTKQAAKWAGLEIAEQQDERFIEGAWTHLIRKSRAKWMIEKGAKEVMVKVKLRHTFSVTERYTKPDINALIKWEHDNIEA